MNGLDLFSGIGGLTIALSPWVRPVAYCENDRYATGVLLSRMATGQLPIAPIWDDVRTLSLGRDSGIDIIYGGFPCQDVSLAGSRRGLDGERTGLFREAIRLVRECRPPFVFFENVPGIRKYVQTVRAELEAIGYDCRDGFLSAKEVGAPHIRNRWWLLAHTNRINRRYSKEQPPEREGEAITGNNSEKEFVANSKGERIGGKVGNICKAKRGSIGELFQQFNGSSWWEVEPSVGRVADGIPLRLDRLRGLGNAVVPECARQAFMILMGLRGA